MNDIYDNAKSAVEASEIARSINDDRTGLERLNHLLRKQIEFGKDLSDLDDEQKSEIRDKLLKEITFINITNSAFFYAKVAVENVPERFFL